MAYTKPDATPGRLTQGRKGIESNSIVSNSKTNNKFYEIEPAEVLDVIYSSDHNHYQTPDDIGKVRFRFIHSQTNVKEQNLPWATPLNQNMVKVPDLHEIVLVARYLKKYYVLNSLDVKLSVSNNSYKGASATSKAVAKNYDEPLSNSEGLSEQESEQFEEVTKVKPLRPFSGDVIHQGRFGQSIRFGSTDSGKATVIIRAGQGSEENNNYAVEDINSDASSLYLVEGGSHSLDYASSGGGPQRLSTISTPSKSGAQIIGSSDRIVLNAKSDELLLLSKSDSLLSAGRDLGIETSSNLLERVGGDKYSYVEGKSTYDIDSQVSWNVNKFLIGSDSASEPLVMGNRFKKLIQKLIEFNRVHTHPSPVGPTGPADGIPSNKVLSDTIERMIDPALSNHAFVAENGAAASKGPRTSSGGSSPAGGQDPILGTNVKPGAPYEERIRVSDSRGGVKDTGHESDGSEKSNIESSEHQNLGACPQEVQISEKEDFNISENFSYFQLIDSCTARENRLINDATQTDIRRLRLLANNVLEPIETQFGPIGINSGHRSDVVNAAVGGADASQHRLGEAVDIEVPSVGNKNAFMWIVNQSGISFDQLIYEFGGSWIHISYRKNRNRMQILEAYSDVSNRTQYASISRSDIVSGNFGNLG